MFVQVAGGFCVSFIKETANCLGAAFCTATKGMVSPPVDISNLRDGVEEGIDRSIPVFAESHYGMLLVMTIPADLDK
jgi:hypothetical protein